MAASTGGTAADNEKQYEYQAEVKKLLNILVHSVYSSKDVFLRELVSNAADALEKVRFSVAQGLEIEPSDEELSVWIEAEGAEDAEGEDGGEAAESSGPKTLIVRDNGIGMTEEELRNNLGTIAHSGASAFLDQLASGKSEVSLIGQFGVGFYSVFMVADRVRVTTRHAAPGSPSWVWESDGLGTYTIRPADEPAPRGTRIEIQLKEDEDRFVDEYTIEQTIRTYSNFLPFPVFINGERKNTHKALWREQPSQISDDDYQEFYKFLTYDPNPPFERLHFSTDSPLQFSALLFVPNTDQEALGFGEGDVSLQLYVKRVLIDGSNPDLLPRFLRFVKGVVESEDLPLNISRETLQENRVVAKIRDLLTKKLLGQLEKIAEKEPERYLEFWGHFGRIIKEGHMDFSYRDRVQELFRFSSSRSEKLVSLAEYSDRMLDNQKAIYYLSGSSREALERDPRLEIFRKRGIEVLYLYEMADEVVLGSFHKYRDHALVSADQVKPQDLEDGATDEPTPEATEQVTALVDRFREILGDRVIGVELSERLVDSPACLVAPDGQSSQMDRILRLMNKETQRPKRRLELNPAHPLIQNLSRVCEANRDDTFLTEACEQIFEGALLLDGYLDDPHRLVERMNRVLTEASASRQPE